MRKSKKIIFIIAIIILLISGGLFFFGYQDKHLNQWGADCGKIRQIITRCYGLIGPCRVRSETYDERNYFYKYWEKTHGECQESDWRNYHGYTRGSGLTRKWPHSTYSFSGRKPVWYYRFKEPFDEAFLGFLFDRDENLLKEILDHVMNLSLQEPRSKQEEVFMQYGLVEFWFDFIHEDFDFEQFNEWWQNYRTEYNL